MVFTLLQTPLLAAEVSCKHLMYCLLIAIVVNICFATQVHLVLRNSCMHTLTDTFCDFMWTEKALIHTRSWSYFKFFSHLHGKWMYATYPSLFYVGYCNFTDSRSCSPFRYCEANIKSLDTVRQYSSQVAPFLQNRPRWFIQHCLKRQPPAADDITESQCTEVQRGSFVVQRPKRKYTVCLSARLPSCDCPDWQLRFLPCKHMLAVCKHFPYAWELISPEYRNFPTFVLDERITGIESVAVSEEAHRPDSAPVVAEPAEESTSGDDAITTRDDSSRQLRMAQTNMRQHLNVLSSYSYSIDDTDLLNSINDALRQHITLCKEKVRNVRFRGHRRKRVDKRHTAVSFLRRRLRAVRAKKRQRKLRLRQRRMRTGLCLSILLHK